MTRKQLAAKERRAMSSIKGGTAVLFILGFAAVAVVGLGILEAIQ